MSHTTYKENQNFFTCCLKSRMAENYLRMPAFRGGDQCMGDLTWKWLTLLGDALIKSGKGSPAAEGKYKNPAIEAFTLINGCVVLSILYLWPVIHNCLMNNYWKKIKETLAWPGGGFLNNIQKWINHHSDKNWMIFKYRYHGWTSPAGISANRVPGCIINLTA